MKKSFIYNCLPLLFAAMATFSFTACGGGDGDDTDYAAIAAMQGALGGGTGGSMLDNRIVDLGLSVKWASCNVGATQPWEYGGYYAWGETEEKSEYSWSTYKYWRDKNGNGRYDYNASTSELTNIGSNISGTQYDAATVKWGGSWRMPTKAEQDELHTKCTWQWTTLNSVNGYRVTGPNGNSIFLPATGISGGQFSTGFLQGSFGFYWSGSLSTVWYDNRAYNMNFGIGNYDFDEVDERCTGLAIRPVCP
ncbi:MAG: adenosylhomocysteinase [Bacteroidales bacterium]|nr:adenosylhomocysteinase [Bacteroidales bacterium]